jgi:hypothetical protein
LKPYATILSYGRAHEDYHYDFFNSATVDAQSWGVTSGYREGPVPVDFSFQHSTRDSSGISLNAADRPDHVRPSRAEFAGQRELHGLDLPVLAIRQQHDLRVAKFHWTPARRIMSR